jgi:hypothetical protein
MCFRKSFLFLVITAIAVLTSMSTPKGCQRCLVSNREPFSVIEMSDSLFGYASHEISGQSVLLLCGPWTDSLLLICAISETCVMKSKSVAVSLRDKAGIKRVCTMMCSPAQSMLGNYEWCSLMFEYNETDCEVQYALQTTRHEIEQSKYRDSISSRYAVPSIQSLRDPAIFKETLQYQGTTKALVPNLVFDSSSTISIPRLLTNPEKCLSIRYRRKRDELPVRRHPGGKQPARRQNARSNEASEDAPTSNMVTGFTSVKPRHSDSSLKIICKRRSGKGSSAPSARTPSIMHDSART